MLLLLAACSGPSKDANTAPEEALIAVSPAAPTTVDDLLVTVQGGAADPEGDDVVFAYAWFKDGVDAGVTTDTEPPSTQRMAGCQASNTAGTARPET